MNNEKVVEIEDRIPTLKERRRQRTNRRLIFYVSLFFLLMTIITYLQTSFSHVKTVEVVGNDFVSDDWIIEQSKLLNEVSMWFYDEEGIISNVMSHPEIRDISVSRKLPNTIAITIEEYERIAYSEEDGNYYPLLENGDTIKGDNVVMTSPYDAPILFGFDEIEIKNQFAEELMNVSPSIRLGISEIHLVPVSNDPLKIILYMNDGFVVHSTIRRFSERISPYPSIVEQLDPNVEGILHMRINPYFESFEIEEEDEGENEG